MRKKLSLTIEETTINKLNEAAKEDNRSLSNFMEKIAKEYLERREGR